MILSAHSNTPTAGLLLSGGLDSSILLIKLLEDGYRVQPFYVSTGCRWENAERTAIDQLLQEMPNADVCPIVDFRMPVDDLYSQHWSISGLEVPDETTADEAVYIPARNPLLLLKPALWCAEHGITSLAIATLANNPFTDATSRFCQLFEDFINASVAKRVRIVRPFAEKSKTDILELIENVPQLSTFSCLSPRSGQHCGVCNKCAERAMALKSLPSGDQTLYACASSASLE